MFEKSFNPAENIPDLSGKVILVTGANSGIGLSSVQHFAAHNASKIYLTVRSLARGQTAIDTVKAKHPKANVHLLQLDLEDFSSVKKAAEEVISQNDRLDVLLLNAGICQPPHSTSKEGYEVQFGTNHMGHALFCQLLIPLLPRTANQPGSDVRVVVVSSLVHRWFMACNEGIDFDELKGPWTSASVAGLYGMSKLANLLFANELAATYPSITTASVHPGMILTGAWAGETVPRPVMSVIRFFVSILGVSTEVGAYNQVWASTNKSVRNGGYYNPVGKIEDNTKWVKDKELAVKLWDWTNKELAEKCGTSWPSE